MPWYLYLALKQLFPSGRKFPFFTAISILGVALGVAVLVISTSVMDGFGYEIRRMAVDTQGDVQVLAGGPIDTPAAFKAQLDRIPGVVAATPFLNGVGVIEHELKPALPTIRGVDVNNVAQVIPLEKYTTPGALANLDDDSIIVSRLLALTIGAAIGDSVEIHTPLEYDKLKNNEVLFPRRLQVVGLFEIGHPALDSSLVLVTLRTMQDLYNRRGSVDGYDVKIAPGADPDRMAARINAAMPPALHAHAYSWIETNHDLLFILQLEKNMIFFLLMFIVIVAAFSVTSSLLISVVRKTREIGLLGALGGKPRQVAACFCFQGFFIGVAGTMGGFVLGFGILYFRDNIVYAFTRITQSEAALQRFYQFSHLPKHSEPAYMAAIVICTIVISTLAGLLPAWRAARLKPVEALRSE